MNSQNMKKEWGKLLKFCTQLKEIEKFEMFFELFLTINERQELVARYQIVRELIDGGKTQREIAEYLKVSIAKITRGSNQLKVVDDKFKKFIKDIID